MSTKGNNENQIFKEVDDMLAFIEDPSEISLPIQTVLVKRKKDFEKLFDGFTRLRAVSYVVSPDILLDFFENGYDMIEVVVGENITDSYRQKLSEKPLDVVQSLEDLVAQGKLKIYGSKRPIHTKLFILENDDKIRVIQGSANLTTTARKAHQINYCWYVDFPMYNNQLEQIISDYEKHKQGCKIFMEDLTRLMHNCKEEDKGRIVEVWLQNTIKSEEAEIRKIMTEITGQALGLEGSDEGDPLISISLSTVSSSHKMIRKVLSPFNPQESEHGILLDRGDYLNHVKHGMPLMGVDLKKKKVVIGLNGEVYTRTAKLGSKAELNEYLNHVEKYIQTVDLGVAPNPLATKMNMYEAFLYIFTTPFFNEYMKMKRKKVGAINLRGPRFLYIYGQSHNGKTTFLRFVLKLLSGHAILPIPGSELVKNRIFNATTKGTCFPLIFDDVPQNKWRKGCSMEDVCKNYWERQWDGKSVFPQMVLSSNEYKLPGWGQSRVKRIEFDVLFRQNIENQQMLNELISKDNPLFNWFSFLYINHLENDEILSEDELYIARTVMKELYDYSNRELPDFFPHEPVEKIYDPGKTKWDNLLNRIQKAELKRVKDTLQIKFDRDMKYNEISEYLSCLPQTIKHDRNGNLIVIENPEDFNQWLKAGSTTSSLFKRITNSLRFHK